MGNIQNAKHDSALHLTIVNLLLETPVNVNVEDKGRLVPLYNALWNKQESFVELLLGNGANANEKPIEGFISADGIYEPFTPLGIAIYTENLRNVQSLLEHGANPNTPCRSKLHSLNWAIEKNNIKIISLLLKHGSNVNFQDEQGRTPLHKAFWSDCTLDIMKLLLEYGADVNIKVDGYNSFHDAIRTGDADIVKLYLEFGRGIDFNARNIDGETSIETALNHYRGYTAMMIVYKKM